MVIGVFFRPFSEDFKFLLKTLAENSLINQF